MEEQIHKVSKMLKTVGLSCEVFNPNFDEKRSGQYIVPGEHNDPLFLISLMNRSAKHNAIVKNKANMVGGSGWNKQNLSTKAQNFLINTYNKMDLDEILARNAYDLEIYGAFCLNIIWSQDRTTIAEIGYMNPLNILFEYLTEEEIDSGKEPGYWYCKDWKNKRKYPPVYYPPFSAKNRKQPSQILYVAEYRPGTTFYGQPSYIAAVNWIEMEAAISAFHLNEIKDGFTPSMVINFPEGIPSDEEMENVVRRLEKRFGGPNGKKTMFTFSEGPERAPVFTPIQLNDSDERFIEINKEVTQGVLTGHGVTSPTLFGIKTEGELGNSNEIKESLSVFQASYIDQKQYLIEKMYNRLARLCGIDDKLTINKYELKMEIKTNPQDLLNILQSTLPTATKKQVFISIGYTPEQADDLLTGLNDEQKITE